MASEAEQKTPTLHNSGNVGTLSESLGLFVRQADRVLSRQLDDALRPIGLTSGQMIVLGIIGEHHGIRIHVLADIVGKDHTTVTANLEPLTACGMVEIVTDSDDQARMAVLTVYGEKLDQQAREVLKLFEAELLSQIHRTAVWQIFMPNWLF